MKVFKKEKMQELSIVLDKRITIQKKGEVLYDDENFPINPDGFNDWKTVWASMNNLYGGEYWSAKALQAETTVVFTVMYSNDLEELLGKDGTKLYRIYWNKRAFNITFVDNKKYENKWLKIKAEVV